MEIEVHVKWNKNGTPPTHNPFAALLKSRAQITVSWIIHTHSESTINSESE